MPTPLILQKQKAEIVKTLEEAGQTASEYSWTDVPSEYLDDCFASTIGYKLAKYYFRIDKDRYERWVVTFCPSDKKWIFGPDSTNSWEDVLQKVMKWSGCVSGELDAKSYLAIAMNSPALLQLPAPEENNTQFTDSEQQLVIERLDRIEEELLGLREGDDLFRVEVVKGFHFLREEVARSGRAAFRYTLFAALLAIGLQFLGPDQTKSIIDFAGQQMSNVSQLLTSSPSN